MVLNHISALPEPKLKYDSHYTDPILVFETKTDCPLLSATES
jgi:hypothetical protein